MRQMMLLSLILVALVGCGRNVTQPLMDQPQHVLFPLVTDIGDVDVTHYSNLTDGSHEIVVHPNGVLGLDGNRRIYVSKVEGSDGVITEHYRIAQMDGTPLYHVTRKGLSDGAKLEVTLEAGGDRLDIAAKVVGGVYYENYRVTRADGTVDRMQLHSLMSAAEKQNRLAHFQTTTALGENPEQAFLWAVVFSADWETYLVPANRGGVLGMAGATDDEIDRNIRRVCAVASIASFISGKCLFSPWCWVVFVPATGISLACAGHDLVASFGD